MKVNNLTISQVFSNGGNIHYVLPHFQREYTWGKREWETLINDALEVYDEYSEEKEPEHFLGSIVVIDGGRVKSTIPVSILVDGQQRLTTISLMLCALRDIAKEKQPLLAKKIQKVITNADEIEDIQLKLLPTTKYEDRVAYRQIVLNNDAGFSQTESGIPKAYDYLISELKRQIDSIDIERFFIILVNCFQVVIIELNRDESPYRIFESLNAKGKHLSQADLVRNYIAMKLPATKQEIVFKQSWEAIESVLQEKRRVARLGELTAFIRHYLAMETSILCSEEHIYARFRDRMQKGFESDDAFIKEIERMKHFAMYYHHFLQPSSETNQAISERLSRLNVLEISTAYPFLLAAYDAFETQDITLDDFIAVLDILENYMIRRYLASEQTSYLNKMFPTLWRDVNIQTKQMPFLEALKHVLATKNCPPDRKIQESAYTRNVYRSAEKLCMIMNRINRHLSRNNDGYTELMGEPTVEHIMPQTLTEEWRAELGNMAEQVHQDYLHTLGNLTIVTQAYNAGLSNSPFRDKRRALEEHILRINSQYFSELISVWNEISIRQRADFLVELIVNIWPSLGEVNLEQTRQKGNRPVLLIIKDENFFVKLWRDVAHEVAEYCIRQGDFLQIKKVAPTYFTNDATKANQSAGWSRLSNQWYIYVYMDRMTLKRLCQRFLKTLHITETQWQVIEESVSPISGDGE